MQLLHLQVSRVEWNRTRDLTVFESFVISNQLCSLLATLPRINVTSQLKEMESDWKPSQKVHLTLSSAVNEPQHIDNFSSVNFLGMLGI